MLALQLVEDEPVNALGIPLSQATDSRNQFRYITDLPTTDFALQTLAADQQQYYDRHDTNKDRPMNRAGHLWRVHLPDQ